MKHPKKEIMIPTERIIGSIYIIRGKKVILDRDMAKLYGVPTFRLNEQVRRNIKRFPDDFMFQLTKEELKNLISQFAISSWGGVRKLPLAFTEPGVAMLASVLNSDRAIAVNIQIVRTFIKLRELIATNEALRIKVEEMEKKYDENFAAVFNTLKLLMNEEKKPEKRIGFTDKKGKGKT